MNSIFHERSVSSLYAPSPQLRPNPFEFCSAIVSFLLSFGLESYCGRSRRLKQVIADGSRSESSPCHWIIRGILPGPALQIGVGGVLKERQRERGIRKTGKASDCLRNPIRALAVPLDHHLKLKDEKRPKKCYGCLPCNGTRSLPVTK